MEYFCSVCCTRPVLWNAEVSSVWFLTLWMEIKEWKRKEEKIIIIELRISRPTKNKLNSFEPSSNKRYVIYSIESFDIKRTKEEKKNYMKWMKDMEQKTTTSTTTRKTEYHWMDRKSNKTLWKSQNDKW